MKQNTLVWIKFKEYEQAHFYGTGKNSLCGNKDYPFEMYGKKSTITAQTELCSACVAFLALNEGWFYYGRPASFHFLPHKSLVTLCGKFINKVRGKYDVWHETPLGTNVCLECKEYHDTNYPTASE
jgi:hypothetical protein